MGVSSSTGINWRARFEARQRALEVAHLANRPLRETISDRVWDTAADLRESIMDILSKQVPEEIKSIVAKDSVTIEEIELLQEFRKARDICVVLEQLAEAINIQVPIDYSKLDSIRQTAKDFPNWTANANQATLSAVTRLSLKKLQLQYIPPEIWNLTSLTTLDLSDNKLADLPPEIWNLTSLTTLDLSDNKLADLSPEIGNLTSLTTLNLSNNKLASLPSTFGQLTNLKRLCLSDNKLTTLPSTLENLHYLEYLFLPRNQLTALPPEIAELKSLPHLITLDLSGNKFTDLPTFEHFTSLKRLSLLGNRLTTLPPGFNDLLKHVKDLTISGNQFRHLSLLLLQAAQLDPTFSPRDLMTTQEVRYVLLPLIALGGVCLGDYLTAGAQHIANAFFS